MADETLFTIRQGDTWAQELVYADASGAGVNLTGWTARMMARKSPSDDSPIFDLTTANQGIVFTDALNGKLELRRTAAQTQALTPGSYHYDLRLTKPDGVTVITLVHGTLTVAWGITHA